VYCKNAMSPSVAWSRSASLDAGHGVVVSVSVVTHFISGHSTADDLPPNENSDFTRSFMLATFVSMLYFSDVSATVAPHDAWMEANMRTFFFNLDGSGGYAGTATTCARRHARYATMKSKDGGYTSITTEPGAKPSLHALARQHQGKQRTNKLCTTGGTTYPRRVLPRMCVANARERESTSCVHGRWMSEAAWQEEYGAASHLRHATTTTYRIGEAVTLRATRRQETEQHLHTTHT